MGDHVQPSRLPQASHLTDRSPLMSTPLRLAARGYVAARTATWPAHSRLFAVGERTGWSVDEDARHVEAAARRLGFQVAPARWARFATAQSVYLASHFEAMQPRWLESAHRLGTAYLHGRPGTAGYPEFDRAYEALRSLPDRFSRIQVTHAEMRDLVLEAGVEPGAVHVIPIGIDLENFPLVTPESRSAARARFALPRDAFVVGSFQKDGVGWGEGLTPKLIKGPDVLIAALRAVYAAVPELHVLLTGPARGYVRRELGRAGIPNEHVRVGSRAELAAAYHAADVCLVPARQEGGPKSVLEAMASGVPLVTTQVGQATELVEDGVNGWLVDVEDAAGLAERAISIHAGRAAPVMDDARATAERYALERLDTLWDKLLAGFVERDAG
jgi:glycosyltransferase involved in cell wall biosynthesis